MVVLSGNDGGRTDYLIVATAIASGSVGREGSSTGNIIVNVSNGTPSYTYTWSNGTITGNGAANGNMFTISNVGAGTYSITLTDANGCTGVTGASIGGNIGGVVFNDYNTDGFMADTEPGLDSVLVYLYECNIPVPVDSVWTDANGAYTFPNLGNFPYRVEFCTGGRLLLDQTCICWYAKRLNRTVYRVGKLQCESGLLLIWRLLPECA